MADISTKPWSNFTASDYTPEQWKAACLIVRGDGSTQAMCSLPVKEPDGTLNKNACIAAAGALAGARGGVNATDEEKAKARSKLRGLYSQIGMDAPMSLMHFENTKLDTFLAHFGIKGQKWGVRRSDSATSSGNSAKVTSSEAVKAHNTITDRYVKGIKSATNEAHVEDLLDTAHLNDHGGNIKVSNVVVSPNGQKIRYEIDAFRMTPNKPNTNSTNGIKVEHISKEVDRLKPGMGLSWADKIKHNEEVNDFLAHFGIKGQKWGVRRTDSQLASLGRQQVRLSSKVAVLNAKAALQSAKQDRATNRRFFPSGNSSSTSASSKTASAAADALDAARARVTLSAIKKGGLQSVSDADLNHLVSRLNLEKRYDEINPSAFTKLHNVTKSSLNLGRTMNEAIKFSNSQGGHLLLDKLLGTQSQGRHVTSTEAILKQVVKKSKNK